jgi:putative intracellular protease/amidase
MLQVHVVVSGHLLTGQNPASAGPLGKAIHEKLAAASK